jgi:hypothetical protein
VPDEVILNLLSFFIGKPSLVQDIVGVGVPRALQGILVAWPDMAVMESLTSMEIVGAPKNDDYF